MGGAQCCSCTGGIREYLLHRINEHIQKNLGIEVVANRYHRLPTQFEDYYFVKRKLGAGTYASVYALKHKRTGQPAADKSLSLRMFKSKRELAKIAKHFCREIEILMRLDNPYVVKLHEVFESPAGLHLVMELLEGGSLQECVDTMGSMSEKDAVQVTHQMLTAVGYLHQLLIVHRDLKPDNFVRKGPELGAGDLKLIDFGMSKYWSANKRITKASGTLPFQAPEVLDHSYDIRCDLWSLGVIIFFLLMSSLPFPLETPAFPGENVDDKLRRRIRRGAHVLEDPERWSKLSELATRFVLALLQVRPEKRPSAKEALGLPWMTCECG